MMTKALRIIDIKESDPRKIGHQHGETLRQEISEIAEIRLERMCNTSAFKTVKEVLTLADEHVPLLEQFDMKLYHELLGIAEGSNVSVPRLIVLNNYTDMRDIKPAHLLPSDDCSIIYSPGEESPILGQTWDIHGSAYPYVILLKLKEQMLFSIAGCLGMTGINRHGTSVAINNLSSIDARVGVIWPAIVRKALSCDSAEMAKEEIMQAKNGSGRHYAVADDKQFFSIETSGTKRKIILEKNDVVYFHTNHCLDEEMRKTHTISQESTTLWRFKHLDEVVRHMDLSSPEKVFLALSEVGLPLDAKHPHNTATCGTVVMDIKNRSMLACAGIADKEFLSCNQAITHF
ncbi:MAG TPA: C45 family peptidase [Myxococcota bacterium]|nr:C45 family peptidase [Myxococcota bacterium]